MADNRELWTELGIDLKQHDVLLGGLGPAFADIYLSQKDRPKGMGFFDFVVGDIHGIRVHELREHAREGGKVVATYCVFVPEEFVWAAGGIPVGLCAGTHFSVPHRRRGPAAQHLRPHQVVLRLQAGAPVPLRPVQPPDRGRDDLRRQEEDVRNSRRAPAGIRHGGAEQEDRSRPRPLGW